MPTRSKRMGLAVRVYLLPVILFGTFMAIIFGLGLLAFVIELLAKLLG
jgi:hypothetical protein